MPTPRCPGRRAPRPALVGLVLALVALPFAAVPAPARAASESGWLVPVDGPVVRPFQEPIARYGPGHRGVDFAAAPGTPVRASNDGVVVFAGDVAGALHVVVAHDGGIRTSYSFLLRVDVHTGQTVRRGDVVGAAGGTGDGHGPGVLHFGVRVGDRYVDPMLLFRPRDLTAMVRLVPAAERAAAEHSTPAREARALAADHHDEGGCGIDLGPLTGIADEGCDAAAAVAGEAERWLDDGLDALARAGEQGARLAQRLGGVLHDLLHRALTVADRVASSQLLSSALGAALVDLVEIGRRLDAILERECDDDAPPADGHGGSGNALLAVGGIDSARRTLVRADGSPTRSFALPVASLGYASGDVSWFSYRLGAERYEQHDTHGALLDKARLLAQELRDAARRHPGRHFDLIGHSQGGVVILVFLAVYYVGHESEYPAIDNVVTFASPLHGAPLATTASVFGSTALGAAILRVIAEENRGGPPEPDSPAIGDLAETSDVIRRIARFRIPASIHATAIEGTLDPVVPADHASLDGMTEVPVDVGHGLAVWNPFDYHSDIVRDPNALRAARAALEHRAPPCASLGTALRSAVAPVVYSRVSHDLTALAAAGPGLPVP